MKIFVNMLPDSFEGVAIFLAYAKPNMNINRYYFLVQLGWAISNFNY